MLRDDRLLVLSKLLETAYVPKGLVDTRQIEEVDIAITLWSLALKANRSENTTRKHLKSLNELTLVSAHGTKGESTIYRLNLTPMLEWEKARSVRDREYREFRDRKNLQMLTYRAKKKAREEAEASVAVGTAALATDPYDELIAYAEVAQPRHQAAVVAERLGTPVVVSDRRMDLNALEEAWRVSPRRTPEERARRKELRQAFMDARSLQQPATPGVDERPHSVQTSGMP